MRILKVSHTKRTPWKKSTVAIVMLGILSSAATGLLVYFLSPDKQFAFYHQQLPALYLFFPAFFLCIFSVITVLTRSKTHGILFALFLCIYLGFRLNKLTDTFFLVILIAIFLTLELIFSEGKKRKKKIEETRQIKL